MMKKRILWKRTVIKRNRIGRFTTCPVLCVFMTSAAAGATEYQYDALGRLETVTYDNGDMVHYSYDANGNIRDCEYEAVDGTGGDSAGSGNGNPGDGGDNAGSGSGNPGAGGDDSGSSNPGDGGDNAGSGSGNPGDGGDNSGSSNPGGGGDNAGSGSGNPGDGEDNSGSGNGNPGDGGDNAGSGSSNPDIGGGSTGNESGNLGSGGGNPGGGTGFGGSNPTASGGTAGADGNASLPAKEPKKGDVYSIKNARYQIVSTGKSRTVTLKSFTDKKAKKFTIPATVKIDGRKYNVVKIASKAFQNKTKLTQVTIGKNITQIGSRAFYKCRSLKKVTVKTKKLKSVGKNAFKGISQKAVIKVPRAQYSKYTKPLKNKGQAKSVKIKK